MEDSRRSQLARAAIADYPNGPDASLEATAAALDRLNGARSAVLVEGVSDQVALDAVAARIGLDLTAEAIVIVPMGGAHAAPRFISVLARSPEHGLTGLYDVGEEQPILDGLVAAGYGPIGGREDLERAGFFVCAQDLEDELIRAAGPDLIESVLAEQEDLGSFRTMQKQPAWRDQAFDAQIRRFLGAGARRKLRYAGLLTRALDLDAVPEPLTHVLAAAAERSRARERPPGRRPRR